LHAALPILNRPLDYGKQRLRIAIQWFCTIKTIAAALQPTVGHVKGSLSILVITRIWRTLVKCHNDICTDNALRIHDIFWGEQMLRTIDMRTEGHTFLFNFAHLSERVHLIASRVSQQGLVPPIELM